MKLIKYKLSAVIFCFWCCLPLNVASQTTTENIQSAYIYNFIKHIKWPTQNNETFVIGYHGENKDYAQALQAMQGMDANGRKIDVLTLSSIEDSSSLQMLVLDKKYSKNIQRISKQLNSLPVVIVSDNAADKKYTMLNFIETKEQTLTFELNRYQMLNANLVIGPDILVSGGSELDIASVLKEMQSTITKSFADIEQQSKKLQSLKQNMQQGEKTLAEQQLKLAKQAEKSLTQAKQLAEQKQELQKSNNAFNALKGNYMKLNNALEKSQQTLNDNEATLLILREDIANRENSIQTLESQIQLRKVLLERLKGKHLDQEEEIVKKSNVIYKQNIALIIAVAGCFIILIMLIIIYKSRQSKHKANEKLQENITVLAEVNSKLSSTQEKLVEAEKMAALGGLVAGVAHEINTPLGVSVTATSHLAEQIESFEKEYKDGQLKRSSLNTLLDDARESTDMLKRNLERAGDLIRNFKMVAVDQSSENKREFELIAYIEELNQSLNPQLKQQRHNIEIDAKEKIILNSYPGIIAQVLTNLIMNSVNHGFKGRRKGLINIAVEIIDKEVVIDYHDDGIGLDEEQMDKVFEPFYTTTRGSGGSGLGMSISYNLITSKLMGDISCVPSPVGAHFTIRFPLVSE